MRNALSLQYLSENKKPHRISCKKAYEVRSHRTFLSLAGTIQHSNQAVLLALHPRPPPPSRFPSDVLGATPHHSCGTAQVFHLLLY